MSIAAFLAISVLLAAPAAPAPDLRTTAEKTSWKKTGRYDEVIRLCADFATAYPGKVKCQTFAQTPEGRPMLALIASADGVLTAADARAKKRPVVLYQGGIHAGEIDGKDAGFQALREMLDGKAAKGALSKVTAVFVPVFNVDGHERFGKNNRPNQIGPEEMGWRVTAQNLNLNRDYLKADAPEMVALLALLNEWDPIVYVDLHVTDGAEFRHTIAYLVDEHWAGAEVMAQPARALKAAVKAKLEKAKHLPIVDFYPAFNEDENPASGFAVYVAPPRFSSAYWTRRNRIGVLVETHSWKDYATRVRATRDSVIATFEETATNGPAWLDAAARADRELLGGKDLALVWGPKGPPQTIDFLGYAYTRSDSDVSKGTRVVYDRKKPEVWKVPFLRDVEPVVTASAPKIGYVVPAAHAAWVARKLEAHGISFTKTASPRPGTLVQVFRATGTTFGTTPSEGRQTLKVKGDWMPEHRDIPAGSLLVPAAQPRFRLAVELFEPMAPDSLLSWGFFNVAFEKKEYLEPYVAETVAREMMAKDPKVKAAFEARVAEDPAFAKDPAARLEFFHQRHPSYDERFNLYPVYRE